jgi:trimeric autotransporter adhesin
VVGTLGVTLALTATTVLLALPASPGAAAIPTEPLNQINSSAGSPGLGSDPAGVSEGPGGVAVHGNDVYIADTTMSVVRDYNTMTGTMSVLTGTGEGTLSGIGGPAAQADVLQPLSVATDPAGDVFILSGPIDQAGVIATVDYDGTIVNEVPASSGTQFGQAMTAGHIYTIAGTDARGSSGLGGPAPSAEFDGEGITVDSAGNLYIADTVNSRALYVPTASCTSSCIYGLGSALTAGDIYLLAGDGSQDYSGNAAPGETPQPGDGVQATDSSLEDPVKVAVDGADDVYISDGSLDGENRIREVDTAGVISTLTGGQGAGVATGIGQSPGPVAFGDGNLYVGDRDHDDIRMIDPSTGVVTLIGGVGEQGYTGDSSLITSPAAPDGVPATQAELELSFGGGMAVDAEGDVFFVQDVPTGEVIRAIAGETRMVDGFYFQAGYIYTLGGSGTEGYSGNGTLAPDADFGEINQLTFDSAGDLLLVDSGNDVVQLIAAANCTSSCPFGLSGTAAGALFTIAGTGQTFGYTGDSGPATSATLHSPQGIALNSAGDLFIGDTDNNVIREVTPSGTISTYAGSTAGTPGSTGNGGPGLSAEFDNPTALAVDGSGDLYIADIENNEVREIAPTGSHDVSLAAGNGTSGFSGDGGAATSAELNIEGEDLEGAGVAVDTSGGGDLYISDTGNNRVREVFSTGGETYGQSMTNGDIYTVAGNGTEGESGDGGPAATAEIFQPNGIMSDATGDVFLFEEGTIREVAGTTGTQWGQSMTAGDIYTIAGNGTVGTAGDGGPALSAGFDAVPEMARDGAGDIYLTDSYGG